MTAPLPACSAVFQRHICPHTQLFAKEYKRSNRSRGNKEGVRHAGAELLQILRCFPHCCPYHVDRSYCGSPVEVLVQCASPLGASLPSGQADQDLDPSFHLANAFVFARFESENEDALHDGPHSLRDLRSASQHDEEVGPLWIEGIQKWQSGGSQTSRNSNRFAPTTFTLNGQPFDKWYHHWESGANRSQRATRHALKAYVFYPSSVNLRSLRHFQQSSGVQQEQIVDATLELLCVVSSPLFTVTSYRRSSSNAPAASVDIAPAERSGEIDRAALRVHHFGMNESQREVRHQQDHDASRDHILRNQDHSHIHTNQVLPPLEKQKEKAAAPRSSQRFSGSHQARQARQREEYLELQLLSPEEAAQSAPFLHSQIQSREPRLVFDRKRRRAGSYQCQIDPPSRNGGIQVDDGKYQGPTLHRGIASKAFVDEVESTTRTVGISPSSMDPMRAMAKGTNAFDSQSKALQRPLESRQATLHQLTDLAVIHFVASRATAKSVRRGSSDLPTMLAVAIAAFWGYDRGEAVQLANVVFAVAGGSGDSNATRFQGRNEGSSSEEVLQALARVCIWTLSPENLEWMQNLLAACYLVIRSSSVSSSAGAEEEDETHLRSAFLTCAGHCWVRLDEFLQIHQATQPTIRRVRDLTDAVVGFVYSDPALEGLRPELRGVLQRSAAFFDNSIGNMSSTHDCGWSLVLWRQFVANVEGGCTRNQYPGCGFPAPSPNAPPSSWTGEWMLQPGSLAVDARGGTLLVHEDASLYRDVPALWTSCRPIAQLLRLKLTVAGDSLYFLSLREDGRAWTQLLCDGCVHSAPFNAAPDLVSSCIGGDYIAYRLEQASWNTTNRIVDRTRAGQSDHDPICLEFYWWSRGPTQANAPLAAFRAVVTLKIRANNALIEGQVCLERGFVEQDVLAAAFTPRLECWSPQERVDAVTDWKPWVSVQGIYTRTRSQGYANGMSA